MKRYIAKLITDLCNVLTALCLYFCQAIFLTKVYVSKQITGLLMKDINFGAFESLYDFYTAFPNEETCIAYLDIEFAMVKLYTSDLFKPLNGY